jgi:hypothetical protein
VLKRAFNHPKPKGVGKVPIVLSRITRWVALVVSLVVVVPLMQSDPAQAARAGFGWKYGWKNGRSELTRRHLKDAGRVNARMSVLGYRVYGTGGLGLKERSGPGTEYSVIGVLAEGTWIDITCQQRSGSSVGGSSIWDRLNGGAWVSDYYVSTPVFNDFSPGIPRCDVPPSPPPPPPVVQTREQNAVSWARSQLGAMFQPDGKFWNGRCDRFVANAYGKANSGYLTAYSHWLDLQSRGLAHPGDHNIPLGGLAFYWNTSAGHVMISEGNGYFISTGPRVYETPLSSGFGTYLGWAPANPEWPGR